jgi:hypothetical protein
VRGLNWEGFPDVRRATRTEDDGRQISTRPREPAMHSSTITAELGRRVSDERVAAAAAARAARDARPRPDAGRRPPTTLAMRVARVVR